jgi:hypothetical protein
MSDTFQDELAERARQLAGLQAGLAANRDRPRSEWAAQTSFPYLAVFSRDDVEEFARELAQHVLDAEQRGTLENLRRQPPDPPTSTQRCSRRGHAGRIYVARRYACAIPYDWPLEVRRNLHRCCEPVPCPIPWPP